MSRHRRAYGVDGKPLEWLIQDVILDWLMLYGRTHRAKFWRARPSQYIRSQGSNVGFELHPSEIGMPDILGVAHGYFCGIEVKRPGKKLNPEQRIWRDDFLRSERTAYQVVTKLEDAQGLMLYCKSGVMIETLEELDGEN